MMQGISVDINTTDFDDQDTHKLTQPVYDNENMTAPATLTIKSQYKPQFTVETLHFHPHTSKRLTQKCNVLPLIIGAVCA